MGCEREGGPRTCRHHKRCSASGVEGSVLPFHGFGSAQIGRAGTGLAKRVRGPSRGGEKKKTSYRGLEGRSCWATSLGSAGRRANKRWQAKGDVPLAMNRPRMAGSVPNSRDTIIARRLPTILPELPRRVPNQSQRIDSHGQGRNRPGSRRGPQLPLRLARLLPDRLLRLTLLRRV